jgi:hypothetical protein
MIQRIILILILTINTASFFGQDTVNWDKIIIVDTFGGYTHFKNEFRIDRKRLSLFNANRPNTRIKKIDSKLITELIKSIHRNNENQDDPLIMFDRDSAWLYDNATSLWLDYLKIDKIKEPKKIDSIAINIIKNYQKVKPAVWYLQGSCENHYSPFISLKIIDSNDTITISSNGRYPYMLPWNINGKLIYNSDISTIVSQLLPDDGNTNKSILAGENFNSSLIDIIYWNYISDIIEFEKAKNRYPKRFRKLEKHFEITHAELMIMSSIDWGSFSGTRCLKLTLRDTGISPNIEFAAVFGRRLFLHPTKPIIRNKDKILNSLKSNPV